MLGTGLDFSQFWGAGSGSRIRVSQAETSDNLFQNLPSHKKVILSEAKNLVWRFIIAMIFKTTVF